jgi:hypothetical protein
MIFFYFILFSDYDIVNLRTDLLFFFSYKTASVVTTPKNEITQAPWLYPTKEGTSKTFQMNLLLVPHSTYSSNTMETVRQHSRLLQAVTIPLQ